MKKPKFPYVTCDAHPNAPLEPSYAVCVHVLNEKAEVTHVVAASKRSLGTIECGKCTLQKNNTAENYVLICAHAARENAWIPQA